MKSETTVYSVYKLFDQIKEREYESITLYI